MLTLIFYIIKVVHKILRESLQNKLSKEITSENNITYL